jgi:hypothetical protein
MATKTQAALAQQVENIIYDNSFNKKKLDEISTNVLDQIKDKVSREKATTLLNSEMAEKY